MANQTWFTMETTEQIEEFVEELCKHEVLKMHPKRYKYKYRYKVDFHAERKKAYIKMAKALELPDWTVLPKQIRQFKKECINKVRTLTEGCHDGNVYEKAPKWLQRLHGPFGLFNKMFSGLNLDRRLSYFKHKPLTHSMLQTHEVASVVSHCYPGIPRSGLTLIKEHQVSTPSLYSSRHVNQFKWDMFMSVAQAVKRASTPKEATRILIGRESVEKYANQLRLPLKTLHGIWCRIYKQSLNKLDLLVRNGDDPNYAPRFSHMEWRVIDLALLYDERISLINKESFSEPEINILMLLFKLMSAIQIKYNNSNAENNIEVIPCINENAKEKNTQDKNHNAESKNITVNDKQDDKITGPTQSDIRKDIINPLKETIPNGLLHTMGKVEFDNTAHSNIESTNLACTDVASTSSDQNIDACSNNNTHTYNNESGNISSKNDLDPVTAVPLCSVIPPNQLLSNSKININGSVASPSVKCCNAQNVVVKDGTCNEITVDKLNFEADLNNKNGQYILVNESPTVWALVLSEYTRRGQSVSLVLLQKRWYELKHYARLKVLSAFRNKEENLHPLLLAITKRFPYLVTSPLPTWWELVQSGQILSEENVSDTLRALQTLDEPVIRDITNTVSMDDLLADLMDWSDDEPEIIEQKKEIIDLVSDSDTEFEPDSNSKIINSIPKVDGSLLPDLDKPVEKNNMSIPLNNISASNIAASDLSMTFTTSLNNISSTVVPVTETLPKNNSTTRNIALISLPPTKQVTLKNVIANTVQCLLLTSNSTKVLNFGTVTNNTQNRSTLGTASFTSYGQQRNVQPRVVHQSETYKNIDQQIKALGNPINNAQKFSDCTILRPDDSTANLNRLDPKKTKCKIIFEEESDLEEFNYFGDSITANENCGNKVDGINLNKNSLYFKINELMNALENRNEDKNENNYESICINEVKYSKEMNKSQGHYNKFGSKDTCSKGDIRSIDFTSDCAAAESLQAKQMIEKSDSHCTADDDIKLIQICNVVLTPLEHMDKWQNWSRNGNSISCRKFSVKKFSKPPVITWEELLKCRRYKPNTSDPHMPTRNTQLIRNGISAKTMEEFAEMPEINRRLWSLFVKYLKLSKTSLPARFWCIKNNLCLLKFCKPSVVKLKKMTCRRMAKRIELNNIDEVRRINKTIQTAQVAPINVAVDRNKKKADSKRLEKLEKFEPFLLRPDLKLTDSNNATRPQKDLTENFPNVNDLRNMLKNLTPGSTEILKECEKSNKKKLPISYPRNEPLEKDIREVITKLPKRLPADNKPKIVKPREKYENKKRKDVTDNTFLNESQPLNDAYQEWQRQKTQNLKYFNIPLAKPSTNNIKKSRTSTEVSSTNELIRKKPHSQNRYKNDDTMNISSDDDSLIICDDFRRLSEDIDNNCPQLFSLKRESTETPTDPSNKRLKLYPIYHRPTLEVDGASLNEIMIDENKRNTDCMNSVADNKHSLDTQNQESNGSEMISVTMSPKTVNLAKNPVKTETTNTLHIYDCAKSVRNINKEMPLLKVTSGPSSSSMLRNINPHYQNGKVETGNSINSISEDNQSLSMDKKLNSSMVMEECTSATVTKLFKKGSTQSTEAVPIISNITTQTEPRGNRMPVKVTAKSKSNTNDNFDNSTDNISENSFIVISPDNNYTENIRDNSDITSITKIIKQESNNISNQAQPISSDKAEPFCNDTYLVKKNNSVKLCTISNVTSISEKKHVKKKSNDQLITLLKKKPSPLFNDISLASIVKKIRKKSITAKTDDTNNVKKTQDIINEYKQIADSVKINPIYSDTLALEKNNHDPITVIHEPVYVSDSSADEGDHTMPVITKVASLASCLIKPLDVDEINSKASCSHTKRNILKTHIENLSSNVAAVDLLDGITTSTVAREDILSPKLTDAVVKEILDDNSQTFINFESSERLQERLGCISLDAEIYAREFPQDAVPLLKSNSSQMYWIINSYLIVTDANIVYRSSVPYTQLIFPLDANDDRPQLDLSQKKSRDYVTCNCPSLCFLCRDIETYDKVKTEVINSLTKKIDLDRICTSCNVYRNFNRKIVKIADDFYIKIKDTPLSYLRLALKDPICVICGGSTKLEKTKRIVLDNTVYQKPPDKRRLYSRVHTVVQTPQVCRNLMKIKAELYLLNLNHNFYIPLYYELIDSCFVLKPYNEPSTINSTIEEISFTVNAKIPFTP